VFGGYWNLGGGRGRKNNGEGLCWRGSGCGELDAVGYGEEVEIELSGRLANIGKDGR
jgi:hypothetical protein